MEEISKSPIGDFILRVLDPATVLMQIVLHRLVTWQPKNSNLGITHNLQVFHKSLIADRQLFRNCKCAYVNILFLLPGLAFGLYLFTSSGNSSLILMSGLTLLVWLWVGQQRSVVDTDNIRVQNSRIYVGDRRIGQAPWLWPTRVRNAVYQALVLEDGRAKIEDLNLEKGSIGWSIELEPLRYAPDQSAPHAILIGPTGRGKTELMKLMAEGFWGELWVIDFKGGMGFGGNSKVKHLVTNMSTDAELVAMQNKFAMRQMVPGPDVLFIVDELGEVMKSPKHAALIESVAAKGRSLGVFLVCANQTLSMIPRAIWVNCESRFSLGADLVDRTQLGFAVPKQGPIPGMGTAVWLKTQISTEMVFPFGKAQGNGKAAPVILEAANPLLLRVDPRLQSRPSEVSARAH